MNAKDMKPKEIVEFLNDYVIGQKEAKKIIAIALRNRWRRMQLSPEMQDDIMPKNILMIGSTGVGKTEIARRLAKMFGMPFIKVEASKYTEVGFVGRDVESMVRDLAAASLNLLKEEERKNKESEINEYIEKRILERLLPPLQFRLQLYCYSVPEQKRFFHQGVLLHLQTISGSVLHSQKPDGHSAQPHEATPSVPASNLQFCLHNFLTSHQFSARFQTEFRPLFRSINVQQPQSAEKARR